MSGDLVDFEKQVVSLRSGHLMGHVLALEYQDYREISELRQEMKPEQFEKLTIEDVADRIVFPWAKSQAQAA